MNKRERKRLEKRKNELVRSLEITQTALALTNGLADDETFEIQQNETAELNSILFALGHAPIKIGLSHKIYRMEI